MRAALRDARGRRLRGRAAAVAARAMAGAARTTTGTASKYQSRSVDGALDACAPAPAAAAGAGAGDNAAAAASCRGLPVAEVESMSAAAERDARACVKLTVESHPHKFVKLAHESR